MFQKWMKDVRHRASLDTRSFTDIATDFEAFLSSDAGLEPSMTAIKASAMGQRQFKQALTDLKFYKKDYQEEINIAKDIANVPIREVRNKQITTKLLNRIDALAIKVKAIGEFAWNHPTPPTKNNTESAATMIDARSGVHCSVFLVYKNRGGVLGREQFGDRPYTPPLTADKTKHAEYLWKNGGTQRNGGAIDAAGADMITRIAALWTARNTVLRVEFNITQKPCGDCEPELIDLRQDYINALGDDDVQVPWWIWTYRDIDLQAHVYYLRTTGLFDCGTWA